MESAPFVAVLMMATACTSPDTPKPVASPPWASGIGTKSDTRQFLQTEADALVGFEHGVGVILAIVESDGRVVAAASGYRSGGEPIPTDGRVRIGSVTKTFVSVLVLQLVDEGKLDLDASARTYISDPRLPPAVTVRELLNHTSGIPAFNGRMTS